MRGRSYRKESGKNDGPELVSLARGGGSSLLFADHLLLTIIGQKPAPVTPWI
jgi:hypothetical protein